MKIDDLLTVAGGSALKLFVWGVGVVDIINAMLPADRKITTEITGHEAHVLIRSLPAQALLGLLVLDINVRDGTAITSEVCEPPQSDEDDEDDQKESGDGKKRLTYWRGRIQLPMVLGIVIVLIAVVLTYAISLTDIDESGPRSILKEIWGWIS